MKVVFIDARRCVSYLLFIALAVSILVILGISHLNVTSVFSPGREIPIYYVDCPEKKVALTFDCAWGASDIPIILDTLRKEDVKATFFIVGQWAEKFPDTVRAIAKEGHDVANHSYSHLRMGVLSKDRIRNEISKCSEKQGELSGRKVDLFRAPYGDYSNDVISVARDLGHFTIQWNVDSLDWKPGMSRNEILNRVVSRVKPGSIILFHNDTPHTASLLPEIISSLKRKGYSFLPVSQLILRENYIIDFEGKQKRKG